MNNEKQIEKEIVKYLKTTWWLVETMNWWSIMIKKGGYNHRMYLNEKWCPDILYFYKWILYWIEVKKDQKEVNNWLKIRDRFYWIWKTLDWLKSYDREISQIKYEELITTNWWQFLITCSLEEVKEFIFN